MNRYKEKSKFDEERFLKEDEGYLLKESRPIKAKAISRLNRNKMYQFMDDVLTNKDLTSVLYASNAKIEIKTYIKTKKNFYRKSDELEKKRKEKNEPCSVVKKRSRKEAYLQMREEIDNFKNNKNKYKIILTQRNNKKFKNIKEEIEKQKKEHFGDIKSNYIHGFKRAYSRLKLKLDILKTPIPPDEKFIETEVDYPYLSEFTTPRIHFAEPKLNIKDVYSRLYNNAVLLPKDDKKVSIKKRAFSAVQRKNTNQNKKKEAIFNLRNALKSNDGKEFIIKITDKILNRCYNKYSGGPETTKYLKEKDDTKEFNKESYYVNYYNLVETKNGNSFLHMATLDNFPQLVKYFIEKGANLNLKNNDGNTPLHLALKAKHKDIIKLLMDNKAALDIPNNDGEIPFEYLSSEMKKEYGVDKILVINPVKKK